MIIFGDHQQPDIFYYLRSSKRLVQQDQGPDFQYHLNRYIGHRQTGNKDQFWVRGVIKFSTTSDFEDSSYQAVREQLSSEIEGDAKLLSAPVSTSYNRLVYAKIESDDSSEYAGELAGGVVSGNDQMADQGNGAETEGTISGSLKQRYTIGLTALDAELFWENFHNDNLNLSLSYGWTVAGMILDANDHWVASQYQINDVLPITVSPREYPQLFNRNELWQRLQFTHSNLLVMCYDFINAQQTDLHYVLVQVRFPTLRDQYYSESTKFTAGSAEYEKTLKFQLANDIKKGYEYRVRRLAVDGRLTQTEWIASNNAMLDVSASVSELSGFNQANHEGQP